MGKGTCKWWIQLQKQQITIQALTDNEERRSDHNILSNKIFIQGWELLKPARDHRKWNGTAYWNRS